MINGEKTRPKGGKTGQNALQNDSKR